MKNRIVWICGVGIVAILFLRAVIPFLRETYLQWQLEKVDITPILIQEGDLSSGYTPGKIAQMESDYYQWVQAEKQEILASDGIQVGTVNVFLFASSNEQSELYERYSQVESQEGIIPYDVTDIGECESCTSIFSISGCDINVVFNRCTAVGIIQLNAMCTEKEYDFDYIVAHAKRLDESLKSIAC